MNDLPHTALRGTLHALWLGSLVVPLVAVLREPSASRWLGVVGLVLLAAAYEVALRNGKFWISGVATLVSIPLVAPVGPAELHPWAWIGGIAAGFAPLLLTGVWRWLTALGAVVLAGAVGFFADREPTTHLVIAAAVGATILATAGLPVWFAGLLEQARAGREARAELAVSEERLRFARDVHDLLGHRLTVIALKAELAGRLAATDPERSAAEAFEAQRLASSALSEVRDAVDGYRAVDLAEQLDAVRDVLREAGIRCTVTAVPVAGDGATQLALALREACTNVLRHSRATWCMIDLAERDGEVRMTVTNDGVDPAAPGRQGNGLRGMGERLAAHGGRVSADRSDGTHTLRVVVPT
ncbi:sensor histidine kinase [Nocardia sp. NRRL S-836]|uniref:sensor histidine kinase n=1 Tax=Nocardia sp. NRRL S-836 TaxID=1519492 RepID=UPI0018D07238|nr:histidine kinase [Nocardia sp. NRRL S-836]